MPRNPFWAIVDGGSLCPNGSGLLPSTRDLDNTTKGTRSMATLAASLPKNLQARTTAGILNAVRVLGTVAFGLLALLLVIVGLVEWADAQTNGTVAVLTILGVGAALVSGALFYAVVGWFVDTLSLLTQIAKSASADGR